MHANDTVSLDEKLVEPDIYNFIAIDDEALIHSVPGKTVQGKTFDSNVVNIFLPRVCQNLN